MRAAPLWRRKGIERVVVHLDIGSCRAEAVIGGHLQELIVQVKALVQAKVGDHLVPELRKARHRGGIEDTQNLVQVVRFETALEVG